MLTITGIEPYLLVLYGLLLLFALQIVVVILSHSSAIRWLIYLKSIGTLTLGWQIFSTFGVESLLVVSFLPWLIFVDARVLTRRYEPQKLRFLTMRDSTSFLIITGVLIVLLENVNTTLLLTSLQVLGALMWLVAALTILLRTQFQKLRLQDVQALYEQPTVTVAIPARNETHALSQTLDLMADNTYPKLEILVLDDCSQDQTPQIIRSFAQEGIRFVSGAVPSDEWLGKNYAYQQLLDHASGQYVLFASVDTHIAPQAIDAIVSLIAREQVDILSITPERPANDSLVNALYATSSLVDRGLLSPGYTQNSVWIMRKDLLLASRGFVHVAGEVNVVGALLRNNRRLRYHDVVSSQSKVVARKKLSSHVETMLRTAYPRSSSVVNTALLTTMLIAFYTLLVTAALSLQVIALAIAITSLIIFLMLARQVLNPAQATLATILFPFSIIAYIAVLVASSVIYEFSKLAWKDRNVCIPVMRQASTKLGQ